MSKDGLRRHYGKLTPEERFRLDVLAMARGDKQESERLVSSCSKFSYTMNDRAFTGRWLGALDMTLRVYLELAGHLERVAMMGVMPEMPPFQDRYARDRMRDAFVNGHRAGARQAWEAAKGKGSAPEWPHQGIDEAEVDRLAGLGSSHPARAPGRAGAHRGRARPHPVAGLRGVLRRDARPGPLEGAEGGPGGRGVPRRGPGGPRGEAGPRSGPGNRRGDTPRADGGLAIRRWAGRLMGALRRRLELLEREAGTLYETLTLPGGGTLRYTGDGALEAVVAAVHQDEHPLLARFLRTDATEGMPGLCGALVGSRGDG